MDMNSKSYDIKDLSGNCSKPSFYLEMVKPKLKITWKAKIRCRICELIKRILR
ncbi:MAG: hypothetical protein JW708_06655 [Vallitaleaceae bacterium]|nr:hypothetical protein [Vallitaleaceae bacterium]